MKKLHYTLGPILCALALAACGGDDTTGTPGTDAGGYKDGSLPDTSVPPSDAGGFSSLVA